MTRRLASELIGTAFLLMIVVGSGIMGESLAQGNMALALLANSLATGAGLIALIQTFGPVSGAHFNPAVTLAERLWGRIDTRGAFGYVAAQLAGATLGVAAAHFMFAQPLLQLSATPRAGWNLAGAEAIATFGLITVIAISGRKKVEATPYAVAAYITSAYWFTSSTSFANPAVTFARMFTDTFTGIRPDGLPGFLLGQLAGTLAAYALSAWILDER